MAYTTSGFNLMSLKTEAAEMMDEISQEFNDVIGYPCKYLVRDVIDVDTVFNDVKSSSFTTYYDILMVIKYSDTNVEEKDFLSKFGVDANDNITLQVNITKWNNEVVANGGVEKPREGDLIYITGDERLWEITYVDTEEKMHNFEYLTYRISAQVFEYNQEGIDLNTGVAVIDNFEQENAYAVDITLGSGSGTYAKDEVVFQGVNLTEATARGIVVGWNPDTKVLRIMDLVGIFQANQMVIGNQTGSSYLLGATVALSTPETESVSTLYVNDSTAQNQTIEYESDEVVDWSETDPFSEGDY